jgi:integrase/recombinase XerC
MDSQIAIIETQPDNLSARDPVALLLADKRSEATRRAYRGDLVAFFGAEPHPAAVEAFVRLPREQIALRLAQWKAAMIGAGLAEATVNRRLSAVRSLLKFCHRMGVASTDGQGLVDGERATAYRDTRGVGLPALRRLLAAPGTEGVGAQRDTALLFLLIENALRRAELCGLDVADFRAAERRLFILGKGKGTQKAPVTLSRAAAESLARYLAAAGHTDGALFRNLDRRTRGGRLTPAAVYDLVRAYGDRIGERLSPHRLRHSSITLALDLTGGDVRRVQRLSRHAKVDTVMRYDDARHDMQGEVTGLLSGALGG